MVPSAVLRWFCSSSCSLLGTLLSSSQVDQECQETCHFFLLSFLALAAAGSARPLSSPFSSMNFRAMVWSSCSPLAGPVTVSIRAPHWFRSLTAAEQDVAALICSRCSLVMVPRTGMGPRWACKELERRCQVQTLRKSRRITSFSSLQIDR